MKNFLTYFISILLALLIGAGAMYFVLKIEPIIVEDGVNTRVEKSVTVTDKGIADGIENVYDAVVVVENYQNGKLAGIGSGFIYDKEGYIMTNHHVVEKSSELKVVLMSGDTVDGQLIGSDEFADIAVIKIDKDHVTKVATIASSEEAKVGDTVFTIGSPMSSSYSGTVTRGILSGKNRMVEVSVSSSSNDWIMNVMQTDAAINPGNSGGPLCNVSGGVIGINSMKVVQSEVEGIGFAIPIEDALEYANKIVNHIEIKRAYLGISMGDISTSAFNLMRAGISIDKSITSGVIVFDVSSGGPCEKAGIKKGDVVVKIGNTDVNNVAELRYYLYKNNPNDTVDVTVMRGTTTKTFKVTLGESD